jgi:photosystem II stability/assembly factor-like uncharacterized protein
VRAFAVHPSNPSDIIVGTGDYSRYGGAGMFRTVNNGATWSTIPLPVALPTCFYRIQYIPGSPNILIAASEKGLLRSTDGGSSWYTAVSGHASDLVIDPTNSDLQYACVFDNSPGVYKSTDRGNTWTRKAVFVAIFGRASLAICRSTPSTLALMVSYNNFLQGVFKSTDSGESWSIITANIRSLFGFDTDQLGHAQAIAIRPNDPNDIFVGGVKLARSTDGGGNWFLMVDGVFQHGDLT